MCRGVHDLLDDRIDAEAIGVEAVLQYETPLVVHGHGPETVDRHVLDVEAVDGRAVVANGRDGEVDRILVDAVEQLPGEIDMTLLRWRATVSPSLLEGVPPG
jgi:hypothetical protein